MNLKPIIAYLEQQELGLGGKTLFRNEMPASCKEGIVLLTGYAGTPINHNLPGYRATGFRMAVRSTDYDAGEELANRAIAALTIQQELQLEEGMLIKQLLPMNEPRPYRRSVAGYWEFEVDVDANYVQT
jgi:hypothetical protein